MDRRRFLRLAGAAIPGAGVSRIMASDAGSTLERWPATVAQQTMARPKYGPDPHPATRPDPVTRKVLYINLDFEVPGLGNLRRHFGWHNPDWLVEQHIRDLRYASFGYANYVVAEKIVVNDFARFPINRDGFRYDLDSYLATLRTWTHIESGGVFPDVLIDYYAMFDEFNVLERVRDNQIDEVWHFGPPYTGVWESAMAGPGATVSNLGPLTNTDRAGRRFIIMGHSYRRNLTAMLHYFGHRAESHLFTVHRNVPARDNLWRRFLRHDLVTPGMAELGNVHFPPNGVFDYDYRNQHKVQSNADDWYHYPWLTGDRYRNINCEEWSTNNRLYLLWWFRHMPHIAGDCDGIAHNWWRYIIDPNTF